MPDLSAPAPRPAAPLLTLALIAAGCGGSRAPPAPPPAPAAAAAATDAWPAFTARFIEEYFKAQPFFAVLQGRHEFDGQMPDLSAAGIAPTTSTRPPVLTSG